MEQDSDRFLRVMKSLMRPLVRVLIARGITAPAFYKLLKTVYVDIAREDFRIAETPPTDSRITMLTGVHRRDVRAILSDDGENWEATRSKTAMFSTVLGQWMARPDYNDAAGAPKALPRSAPSGESFEALVRTINTDIRPRTVLDELLRQNLVMEGEDDLLRITENGRKGPTSDQDKLVFFASNVGDHIAAATENLMSDSPPFFERALFYNQLTSDAVDHIEGRARDLSQSLLETLNAESQAVRDPDALPEVASERYRLGIYFYRETGTPASVPPKDDNDED
ncbi:DUF6502 family protein [Roseovarius sp.]|uniref:DUF6502 family protein n=1 Tax=Roseovarius sp. TaxID=1486281 RepID=UPI00356A9DBA